VALNGNKQLAPPIANLLVGEQEAKVIALRLGASFKGYAHWTLLWLARRFIEKKLFA
jgi:hypothetical protein